MSIISRFNWNNYALILLFACFFVGCQEKEEAPPSPNIVFFLIDDLGWNDVACYGSTFHETPNIDQLAKEGIRFTNAYAACPVCSPTRASVLTGKYPARLNITDWIPGLDPKDRPLLGTQDKHELPLEEKTLAESLQEAGYATGFFGKWHLGGPGFFPEEQGFDLNKGGHWAGRPASYFYPYKNDRKRWNVPGLEGGQEGEYLTDRLTKEAAGFIKQHQNQPFLLYISLYNVHTPIQSKPELKAKYEAKKASLPPAPGPDYKDEKGNRSKQKQDNPAYAGMVQSVDESVGNVLQQLESTGLSDNTIIIFTSDNGGLSTLPSKRNSPTSVVPLRAGKGWLYEGGIRVPGIIKWPGVITGGSTSDVPIVSTDFYPTIIAMIGKELDPSQHPDGQNLVPMLQHQQPLDREALFWHFPHYHGSGNMPSAAVRKGDYKLVEWFEDGTIELFNLKADLSEANNLAGSMPEKAKELQTLLHQWQQEIGALMPKANPAYQGE